MTKSDDQWKMQEAGTGCYLCPPGLARHTDIRLIANLAVSRLYLVLDQRFRGHSVLVLEDHVTGLEALEVDAYTAYMWDLHLSMSAIRASLHPDHMNVALLGNTCPHLHWSIVPRYRSDSRWGKTVWEDSILEDMRQRPTKLTEADYADIVILIRNQLGAVR